MKYTVEYVGLSSDEIISNIENIEARGWKFHSFVPLTGASGENSSVRGLFTSTEE
jgi:hypothetical protein